MKPLTFEYLKRFCAKDTEVRAYLRQPVTQGCYTFFTDGGCIVRVDAADFPAEPYGATAQAIDFNRVIQQENAIGSWAPVKRVKRSDAIRHGKAWVVRVGVAHVDIAYLNLIAGLPGATIMPPAHDNTGIPFVFDSGVGTVMPVRLPK